MIRGRLRPLFLLVLTAGTISAQAPGIAGRESGFTHLPEAIARDQRGLWTSPSRVRTRDLKWLLPLAGTTALLLANDQRSMNDYIHTNAQARDRSRMLGNAGLASLGTLPAFLAWRGWRNQDDFSRDTAWLTGRAVVNALIVSQALHLATSRERPLRGGDSGNFLQTTNPFRSSFPSNHAAAAWSAAAVIAGRYPGWLTKLGVYGLATTVSASRITAGAHFPSDVLVGSALGYLVGRWMARPHDGPHFAGAARAASDYGSSEIETAPAGSTYVPMDSWIYPALDRLAALGLVPSQNSGLRPWTRAECRRQVAEAESELAAEIQPLRAGVANEALRIVQALRKELAADGPGSRIVLESLYLNNTVIAGPVLNDSFHFGQTITNDFGRPFGRGWNSQAGFTVRAESGRFFAYTRAEFQHAPASPADSLATRELISNLDGIPVQPAEAPAATNRFRPVEAYAGVRLADLEFSVGKQSLWWGPTYDAPLSFSSNAEPAKNLRVSAVHPLRFTGPLRFLGAIRGEFILGKLGGHKYTWRPWFNAQKVSFKLTENLEMGFTRWSIFWGVGHPITARSFVRNFTSTNSPMGVNGVGAADPGDRKGGFDFRWRLPGLRNWLTLYSDSYCDDDPSPLAAPRRAAINPGIYLTHVPGIPRLDFRMEAPSTQPMGLDQGGTFIYINSQYLSGNTNYGRLLGNPVGRDGRALQGWSSYWISARTRIQAGYRQFKGSAKFLPGGATQSDATLRAAVELAPAWHAEVMLQYERFRVPLLGGPQTNRSGWIRLTWEPNLTVVR